MRDLLLRSRCSRRTRDAVWAYLVRRSRQDGATWTVACAGMALPALTGVANWLASRFPGDVFDVQAEVLSGFLGGLVAVDLDRPRVLSRLRWSAYRAGFAALSEALDAPTPMAPGFRSAPPQTPWGHPDFVLAKAVRASVLTQTEADLIGATRLEEVPITDWAGQHGTTTGAAYKARRRAESRLVAFIRDEAQDADSGDPVATDAMDLLVSAGPDLRHRRAAVPPSDRSLRVATAATGPTDRPAEEPEEGVSKKRPDSGLLRCGSNSPAPTSPPPSEVPRCV
ncbi:hypothetical protein [Streptomyces sp. NPDC059479]|uniref:hypothetical protein n=1 Tax=Streptomyces sp. NPDC059479 TaxID=3346848 RepID=UPI0036ADC55D